MMIQLRFPIACSSLVAFAVAIMMTAVSPAWAQAPQAKVTAQFMSDVSAIGPGATFTLGVWFEIEPQWHIYWTNPGDSGLPTSVKLEVPDGFTVSEVRYPIPVRFNQPGDVIGYGYHDTLLLTAEVQAPADLADGSEFTFRATATWLSCHDVCIPGRAKLELRLPPAGDGADRAELMSENAAVFHSWLAQLPLESKAASELQKAEWSSGNADGTLILKLDWEKPVTDVELFPSAHTALDMKNVSAETDGKQTRVIINGRLLAGQKLDIDTLPAVVAYTDDAGRRRGFKTSIPLVSFKGNAAKDE